jgi:hypothetical protein
MSPSDRSRQLIAQLLASEKYARQLTRVRKEMTETQGEIDKEFSWFGEMVTTALGAFDYQIKYMKREIRQAETALTFALADSGPINHDGYRFTLDRDEQGEPFTVRTRTPRLAVVASAEARDTAPSDCWPVFAGGAA